ncbi:hypothetical protein AAHB53_22535 [Niallia circulans]
MEWKTILISIISSSGVALFAVKGGISHFYNRRLESFRNELTLLTEEKKLDFQRKIHDFSLYSNKRHELYPEIYKNLLKAKKELKFFMGIVSTLEDIPKIDQNTKGKTFYYIQEVLKQIENAYDHYLYSELFLSDEVSKIGEEIFEGLNEIGRNISSTYSLNSEKDNPIKFFHTLIYKNILKMYQLR